MSTTQTRIVGAGLFFLFVFLSGFWLSRSGKPYSTALFTIHKLIGLATLLFLIVNIYQLHQIVPLGGAEVIAVVVTGLFFVSTIIAGGLMSTDNLALDAVSKIHKMFPYLTTLSTIASLYLLTKQR